MPPNGPNGPDAPLPRHPYADFIHKVQKPARYLGGEYQSVVKADRSLVDGTICLAFPDLYDIGMSHLGTKILYGLLNRHDRIACERAFAPWPDMEAQLRERGMPLLSLETASRLDSFDVVGFSLQYEMTYTNVLNILDLSGIPLRSADRDEHHPIIVAGGPTATHPEPVAPFFDAMLVGDGEEILPRSVLSMAAWRREGVPRADILRRLAGMGGWYVPSLYEVREDPRNGLLVVDEAASEGPYPVVRAFVEDISRYPFPSDTPVPAAEAIFDRVSIEIARGCTEGCRFCQAGMIYRPVRERDPQQVIDTVIAALDRGGYDKVSLTSLSTADYSCISPLIKEVMSQLRERNVSLSVSSLRAYGLAEELLDEISSVKATGLTFAPEAGTQRMRDVVNKNISDADIDTTAERVFSRGWHRMKLYFMIGLPTEADEDVAGIVETAARARDIGLRHHSRRRVDVTASASTHVPKPHTPFQWAAMDTMEEIERKQQVLKDLGRSARVTVKVHNPRMSWLEGIVARGDRRVADVIEAAWRGGCRFDGWDEHVDHESWVEAIDACGLDPMRYLQTLPLDGALPWDHIDVGLADGFLRKEWKRALKDRLSPPCGKPLGAQVHQTNIADAQADYDKKLICYHCGVACDLTGMKDERIAHLRALGAEAPSVPDEDTALPAWKTVRHNRLGARLPPKRADQGVVHAYRLRFTKLGTVAMTSQLDLARSLPRVLRRAGVPLRYSEGFSPHPVVSYGPALPLGVRSLAEVLDVDAVVDLEPEELLARVCAVADDGLIFTAAARRPDDAMAAARAAKLAEYVVAAPSLFDGASLAAAVAVGRAGHPVPVTVLRKKGAREIDVVDGLIAVDVSLPTPAEAALLGLALGTPLLRYRVDLDRAAAVRPNDMARGLMGLDALPDDFVPARTGLWGLRKGVVFDLLAPEARRPLDEHAALPGALPQSAPGPGLG